MKILSAILATAFFWGSIAGAADLQGVVKDSGGEPVAGVFVTAREPGRGMAVTVVSDGAGHYTIHGLFPDSYTLRAAKIGFETASVGGFALSENGGQQDFRIDKGRFGIFGFPGDGFAALVRAGREHRLCAGRTQLHEHAR